MNAQIEHFKVASYFIDADHESIQLLAASLTKDLKTPKEKAIKLYYEVRDMFRYNPYRISLSPQEAKASNIISRDVLEAHCIDKAIVLCALGRAVNIPTRLHFTNVRNHIGTAKLEEYLGTNVLVFHGFMEFYLNEQWVKCTPAFNEGLCKRLKVDALDFDGENDSIFQEYNKEGGSFMEYLHDYGIFHDFPIDMFEQEIRKYYPKVFEGLNSLESHS